MPTIKKLKKCRIEDALVSHISLAYESEDDMLQLDLTPLRTYEAWLDKVTKYPGGMTYPVMGLAGEAGEVANDLVKVFRHRHHVTIKWGDISPSTQRKMKGELSDVLFYLTATAHEMGLTLEDLAKINQKKINARIKRGTAYKKLK